MLSTFSKILKHSWMTLASKLGFNEFELKKPHPSKSSRKWFFESVWQVPKFEPVQVKQLLVATLQMAGLGEEVLNFNNKLMPNEGLLMSVPDQRTRTMAEIQEDAVLTNDSSAAILSAVDSDKKPSVKSETLTVAQTLSSDNELPPFPISREQDTVTSSDLEAKKGSPQIEPTLESFDGERQVRHESSDLNAVQMSKLPKDDQKGEWPVSSSTLMPEADFPYDSAATLCADDETYLYGVSVYVSVLSTVKNLLRTAESHYIESPGDTENSSLYQKFTTTNYTFIVDHQLRHMYFFTLCRNLL